MLLLFLVVFNLIWVKCVGRDSHGKRKRWIRNAWILGFFILIVIAVWRGEFHCVFDKRGLEAVVRGIMTLIIQKRFFEGWTIWGQRHQLLLLLLLIEKLWTEGFMHLSLLIKGIFNLLVKFLRVSVSTLTLIADSRWTDLRSQFSDLTLKVTRRVSLRLK